jgi:hypothetical protein
MENELNIIGKVRAYEIPERRNTFKDDLELFDLLCDTMVAGRAETLLKPGDFLVSPRQHWQSNSPLYTIHEVAKVHSPDHGDYETIDGIFGPISGSLFVSTNNTTECLGDETIRRYGALLIGQQIKQYVRPDTGRANHAMVVLTGLALSGLGEADFEKIAREERVESALSGLKLKEKCWSD